MSQNPEQIENLQKDIEITIEKIISQCYELYGYESYERYARKILKEKDYDFINDNVLNDLVKTLLHLEEQQDNPFASLISDSE